MSEKRFIRAEDSNGLKSIFDNEIENGKPLLVNCIGEVGKVVDLLNEQQATIDKQNKLIKLIANACTYSKEHSVKEILRKEIRGIDTVTEESANAWQDYVILSEFFEEHYKEHWDNE